MGKLLLKNGFIITMDQDKHNFYGDILTDDDRIIKVQAGIPAAEADEIIDAKGKIIIPGLIQTHVHLCQTLFRGMANDLALLEWLDVIMPLESCHDSESSYISAKLGIAEMLKSGTTTFSDMGTVYFYEEAARAVQDTGVRAQLGRTIMDCWLPKHLCHDTKQGIAEAENFISKWHNSPEANITCGLPIRWVLSTTDESFTALRDLALKYKVPIHAHANENVNENELTIKEKGLTAIEYYHKLGLTDAKLQLAHCIYLNEREKGILKEYGASVLHCPSCNMKAASGLAPVPVYLNEGINVSIAADTAACNDNLDPFLEMRLATLMQKPKLGPTAICADDVFYMATMGGAKALQLEDRIGSLEVGKKADIVVLNMSLRNAPFHYENAVSSLVYSFNGRDVNTTIVNGKVLVREGELTGFDELQLIKDAEIALARVIARAEEKQFYRRKAN